ncbi:MAG TPA: hypothetical protein VJ063_16845 [Verrucomicrobiae bacterium]|nr:hypothetical protein [Verrucomicrobiae bacterium]
MRAGPLSNTNIIALLNQYFVPVYVVNEDYAKNGCAAAEEKAELQRIFKEGHVAKKSVGSVHVYILNPDGKLIDSMHVAEAAKPKVLTAMLQKTMTDLKLRPSAPVAKVHPQSAAPVSDEGSLRLHLVSRSTDGKGAWTEFPVENWVVLTAEEQRALLADQPDQGVLKKILTHFYPATENNDVSKNRFESLSASTKRVGSRVQLSGTFKMAHSFYHKEDGKIVEADFIGFVDPDSTGQIKNFQMTTQDARYNGGKFAVAVRSLPH